MNTSINQLFVEAMNLPDESKEELAEKLMIYLSTQHNELEEQHLEIVKRRRDEIQNNVVQCIDGDEALQLARHMLNP